MGERIRMEDLEDLSIAYIQAVCAYASIDLELIRHDGDSTDIVLKKSLYFKEIGRYDTRIDVQLKATSQKLKETLDNIHYPLKMKNYNDLRSVGSTRKFLFVMLLPRNKCEWLSQNNEELIMRRCMYWHDLLNAPTPINSDNIMLHLNKEKIVSPDNLLRLLSDVGGKEVFG